MYRILKLNESNSFNLKGYILLLRAAKYHIDELYDTDDFYNLLDRLSVDDEESPEDFSKEEIEELQSYLDTIPQEDIYRCWDEVHGFNLEESAKLEEKDTIQDYIDFCKDMNIEPKDRKSVNKYMNVFSRMYAQYNGLATLKAAKQQVESELKQYLTEGAKKDGVLTEANIDDELQDELDTNTEEIEDEERVEDIEDSQEEVLDSEEDQEENPAEEESELDRELDELRDILIDLDDIRLYKVVSQDNEEFYILGKVAEDSNDVEMLVDTQPIDYENRDTEEVKELTPEEVAQKYQFISLPQKFEDIKGMNPKYGKDLTPDHEEIVSYLMNLLIEQNPEAAEEAKDEEVPIEEPENDEFPEVPEEINSEEEDEDEEE